MTRVKDANPNARKVFMVQMNSVNRIVPLTLQISERPALNQNPMVAVLMAIGHSMLVLAVMSDGERSATLNARKTFMRLLAASALPIAHLT